MTVKVKEQTISVERKYHPNAGRYPCRSTHEVLEAGRKFISTLNTSERNQLLENDLIVDEEETAELFDSFKENDIVGLGVIRSDGFYSNTYRVHKIHKDEDWMECENSLTKEIEEISFQDVSTAISLGFAEILYREDKPFGVSNSYDFTIKYNYNDEEITDEEMEKRLKESEDKTNNPPELEEKKLTWGDVYYAFGFNSDPDTSFTYYVVITPKSLWDEKGVVCDQNSAEHLADSLGLNTLLESTFKYDELYSEMQLRKLFNNLGATEKSEMVK